MNNKLVYNQVVDLMDDYYKIGLSFKKVYKSDPKKLDEQLRDLASITENFLGHAAVRLTEKEYQRLMDEPAVFRMFSIIYEYVGHFGYM